MWGADYPTSAYCGVHIPSSEASGAGRYQRQGTGLGGPKV